MRTNLKLFVCAVGCMTTILACSTLKDKQPNTAAETLTNQAVIGRWATLITLHKYNDVLLAEFDIAGRYAFTAAWWLPVTPQPPGSQPAPAGIEEGRYEIQGKVLYLSPASGGPIQKCTITRGPDVLILDFGGSNRFTFGSMTNFISLEPI